MYLYFFLTKENHQTEQKHKSHVHSTSPDFFFLACVIHDIYEQAQTLHAHSSKKCIQLYFSAAPQRFGTVAARRGGGWWCLFMSGFEIG